MDIIEKALNLKLNLTEKIVSSTILCCAKEKNGVSPAYTLFKFASSGNVNIPRLSMRVYNALLQGLARESYLDRYVITVYKRLKNIIHLINIPLLTHPINAFYQRTLTTHLSTHRVTPLGTKWYGRK